MDAVFRSILLIVMVAPFVIGGCTGCPSSSFPLDDPEPELDSLEAFLEHRAQPLNDVDDLGPLVSLAGDRRLILLGEASHGTREFYDWRAELSLAIAEGPGLDFVGIEGDWHAARAADRFVMGEGDEEDLEQLLVEAFDRWPQWMWANEEFAQFLRQVRRFNEANQERPIRIYGVDMHAFFTSLQRLQERVRRDHPDRANEFHANLQCLSRFAPEGRAYLQALRSQRSQSCEEGVRQAAAMIAELYPDDSTEHLSARKHMRTIVSGESQFRGPAEGDGDQHWNARVHHFYDVAKALLDHHGPDARGAVWAHNTHIGDARATTMAERNRHNIGQISRENLGEEAVLSIGFSTAEGQVIAGAQWGAPLEVMEVPPAPKGSLDAMLRGADQSSYFLQFRKSDRELPYWTELPGQLGIGVVYDPTEYALRNFAPTNPAARYDALIFIDQTSPLNPL